MRNEPNEIEKNKVEKKKDLVCYIGDLYRTGQGEEEDRRK